MDILFLFDEGKSLLGISDMARELGLSPSTVHRLVKALQSKGLLIQDEATKKYRLGTVFLKFAGFVRENLEVAKVAYPVMQKLSKDIQETVHLNVVDSWERVCIETVEPNRPLMVRMPIGHRSPLYAGASSKCLLAFMPPSVVDEYLSRVKLEKISFNTITDVDRLKEELKRIKKRGYAESFSERVDGLGALSAPVFDYSGSIIASLSVAMPGQRFKDVSLRKSIAERLVVSAKEISHKMGYQEE